MSPKYKWICVEHLLHNTDSQSFSIGASTWKPDRRKIYWETVTDFALERMEFLLDSFVFLLSLVPLILLQRLNVIYHKSLFSLLHETNLYNRIYWILLWPKLCLPTTAASTWPRNQEHSRIILHTLLRVRLLTALTVQKFWDWQLEQFHFTSTLWPYVFDIGWGSSTFQETTGTKSWRTK